jgi:hypothetical protein
MITNITSWSLGLCPNKSLNTVEIPVRPPCQSDHSFFPPRRNSVLNLRPASYHDPSKRQTSTNQSFTYFSFDVNPTWKPDHNSRLHSTALSRLNALSNSFTCDFARRNSLQSNEFAQFAFDVNASSERSPQIRPQFAKRTSLSGQQTRGGLGKPNQKSYIRNLPLLVFPSCSRIFTPFALDARVPQHCSL